MRLNRGTLCKDAMRPSACNMAAPATASQPLVFTWTLPGLPAGTWACGKKEDLHGTKQRRSSPPGHGCGYSYNECRKQAHIGLPRVIRPFHCDSHIHHTCAHAHRQPSQGTDSNLGKTSCSHSDPIWRALAHTEVLPCNTEHQDMHCSTGHALYHRTRIASSALDAMSPPFHPNGYMALIMNSPSNQFCKTVVDHQPVYPAHRCQKKRYPLPGFAARLSVRTSAWKQPKSASAATPALAPGGCRAVLRPCSCQRLQPDASALYPLAMLPATVTARSEAGAAAPSARSVARSTRVPVRVCPLLCAWLAVV